MADQSQPGADGKPLRGCSEDELCTPPELPAQPQLSVAELSGSLAPDEAHFGMARVARGGRGDEGPSAPQQAQRREPDLVHARYKARRAKRQGGVSGGDLPGRLLRWGGGRSAARRISVQRGCGRLFWRAAVAGQRRGHPDENARMAGEISERCNPAGAAGRSAGRPAPVGPGKEGSRGRF